MAKQTFTTGQVLTAAQMTSLQQTAMGGGSTTAKTTSYVLVAADAGTVVQMNAAGSTTITVNTGLFSAGDSVQIQNVGAGVCTITAGTATVNTSAVLTLKQYDAGTLYFNSASAAIFFASDAADSPLTTKGDLYTYSTTNARLGVGSDGTTLVADSTAATGLKWATASSGSIVLLNRTTFSAVSSQSINSVFSSTYTNYQVIINGYSSALADFKFNYRLSGTDATANSYRSALATYDDLGTYAFIGGTATYLKLGKIVDSSTQRSVWNMIVAEPTANNRKGLSFTGWNGQTKIYWGGGDYIGSDSSAYDGFTLSCSTGTMTGSVAVYGWKES